MNKHVKRALLALAIVALLAAGARLYTAQQARKAQAQAQATQAPVVFTLTEQDTVRARSGTLLQQLPLSGTLRSVETALVKARVAGELQGLTVREGDPVSAGQLLGRIDTTEQAARVQQAQQQAEAALAQVASAQRQFDNNQALVRQGFISTTALDNARAGLDAAQANHRAALAAQRIAEKALQDTALRSPLTGHVAARLAQNGERLGVDARVLELVNLQRLELEAALPAADAALVRVGQTATLRVEGLVDAVPAQVARLAPAAQSLNRAVPVYLTTPPHPGLRHGQFVTGQLTVGQLSGLVVPSQTVRYDKPQPYVQEVVAVQGGWRIRHTPVTLAGEGQLATAATPLATGDSTVYTAVKGIADSAILTSARAGFIQENTPVQLPETPAVADAPRTP